MHSPARALVAGCALPPPELQRDSPCARCRTRPTAARIAIRCGQVDRWRQQHCARRDAGGHPRRAHHQHGTGLGARQRRRAARAGDRTARLHLPARPHRHAHAPDRPAGGHGRPDACISRAAPTRPCARARRTPRPPCWPASPACAMSALMCSAPTSTCATSSIAARPPARACRSAVPTSPFRMAAATCTCRTSRSPTDNARFHAGVARGAAEFRERAEAHARQRHRLLKVIASGAVLAYGGVPGAPEMTQRGNRGRGQVAHAEDKKVAAHAHGAESIRMAIDAGVDTVEHASYLDDAGIAAARKRGNVALSMDVYNGDYIDTEGRRQEWPEEFLRKNLETTEIQRQAFTKAVKAGVPIVFGTDAGVLSAWPQCAAVPHHGAARHDAHAGHPVGHVGGRALHGAGGGHRRARAGQVRRPHRRAGRSAVGHRASSSRSTW